MTRALVAVVVATLVVLAGCSAVFGGDGGDGESTPTVTPMAVPTDEPTPTPVPQLAPGLTGEGIENASALVAAHTSRLQNTSFTRRSNTTGLAANGSIVLRGTTTLRAGPSGEGVYSIAERNATDGYPSSGSIPVHTEIWSNDGRLLLNWTYANGTSTYDRFPNAGERYGVTGAGLRYALEPLGTANTSVTELERNGTTLYRVRGRARDAERGNVSVRLIVDTSGLIREYRTSLRTTFGENVSRTVSEGRLSGIGTTDVPERPSWVETALNRTSPVSSRTTATANASSVPRLAPGLTEAGIVDARTLTAAHVSALENRSFVRRSNDTSLAPNGSVLARSTSTLRMGPRGEGFTLVIEKNGTDGFVHTEEGPIRVEYWSDGERVFANERYASGQTVHRRLQTDAEPFRAFLVEGDLSLLSSFGAANTTVAEQSDRNGTRLYRVDGSARSDEWRSIDLELLVDPRGVVHEVEMVRNASVTNDAPTVVTNTRYFGFDATDVPDRPSWVDEAMNRTPSPSDRTTATANATATPFRVGTTTDRNTSMSAGA
ncbi:hypothetical protein [Halococcus agarilyticus]|uniref:hypothetical protein n=1 Tax=Halococcus agarilyticus TaxID=1232219 RepID=UPI000AC51260|nr:hypothetical protein [Halococcus agarilyticus]